MTVAAPRRPPRSSEPPVDTQALIEEARRRTRRRRRWYGLSALLLGAAVVTAAVSVIDSSGEQKPLADRQPRASAFPDGRHFGYVTSARADAVRFDRAAFLRGAAAERAARAAGAIAPGEPLSNDYFIRNATRRTALLPIAAGVRVTLVACPRSCRSGAHSSYPKLREDLGGRRAGDSYLGNAAYWITVAGGKVVALDEQYLP